jgi:hypothetical protein
VLKTFFNSVKDIENEVMIIVKMIKPGNYVLEIQNEKKNGIKYSLKLYSQVFKNFVIDPDYCNQQLNFHFFIDIKKTAKQLKQCQEKSNIILYIDKQNPYSLILSKIASSHHTNNYIQMLGLEEKKTQEIVCNPEL